MNKNNTYTQQQKAQELREKRRQEELDSFRDRVFDGEDISKDVAKSLVNAKQQVEAYTKSVKTLKKEQQELKTVIDKSYSTWDTKNKVSYANQYRRLKERLAEEQDLIEAQQQRENGLKNFAKAHDLNLTFLVQELESQKEINRIINNSERAQQRIYTSKVKQNKQTQVQLSLQEKLLEKLKNAGKENSTFAQELSKNLDVLRARNKLEQDNLASFNKNGNFDDNKSLISEIAEDLSHRITDGDTTITDKLKDINATLSMLTSPLGKLVDSAANTIQQYYGPIAASLDGISKDVNGFTDFKGLNDTLEENVGLSSLVKQQTIISNISNLVSQGVTSDLETLGVLTSIREKTVSSFNVTDGNLRRLVKLNEQRGSLTAKQFGLADALKESFNATFGDTSFLNDMYQSITGTVLDAVSANSQTSTDSTAFYSVLESWLGAMYESGVDSGTVNSIAQGINYLGSGNISALSGNKSLQNLMLLSMDRAGLDYATILQQGLSDSAMDSLLSEIVKYLAEITTNTKENNVLQNSYANLFNMSITDMTAIQHLSQRGYTALKLSGAGALAQAGNEVNKLAQRTSAAERISNVIDNASFSFGSSVADNSVAYSIYKISDLATNAITGFEKMAGGSGASTPLSKTVSTVTEGAKSVFALLELSSMFPGVVGFGKSLLSSGKTLFDKNPSNPLTEIIMSGSSGGSYDGGTSIGGVVELAGKTLVQGASNALLSFKDKEQTRDQIKTSYDEFDKEREKNKNTKSAPEKILDNLEKALMQAGDNADHYAFAVSLQGMSDGVLRSFASIFADEDAMMNTMEGKNEALKKNNTFIDYAGTSSTTNSNNANK